MHFLLPYARIELLIRTMLTRSWDPEAWPIVKHELVKALARLLRGRQMVEIAGTRWIPQHGDPGQLRDSFLDRCSSAR